MPRNKITDLNDHLFAQMERLGDEDLTGEDLAAEIERAKALSLVASNIVGAAKVTVDAMRIVAKGDFTKDDLPAVFSDNKKMIEV